MVSDTLRSVETGKRVTLSNPFIVPGSESVMVADAVIPKDAYVINYHLGTLRIDMVLPPGVLVVVRYRRQPLMLDPVYTLRPVEVSDPAHGVTEAPPAPRAERSKLPSQNLVFGGSKSVSFSVGSNRGSTLDQTLQATIEGQITPTIHVRALLSDNNLPIQPEGNTEELEYFDQVFVELEGTRARASLGDFSYDNKVSTFSPITRQLKGLSAAAWAEGVARVTAAGATSKGVYRTAEFRGITGLQGPYELLSAGRTTSEVIIAGTERVFVDGIEMNRGQNRDYVIDYDRGALTFTPRRLITRDTEIAVDFQITQELFDRATVLASVEDIELPGGSRMHVLVAREGDDRGSPKNTSFGDADVRVLESAGDDASLAITSGAVPADSGDGEYILVPADTLAGVSAHFVFSDTTGTWIVSFVEVAPGTGDYRLGGISDRGRRFYEFVGEGAGSYVVGRRLPLPERVTLFSGRIQRGGKRHLTYDAEWNASDHDRNLLSAKDDDDNIGHAARVRVALEHMDVGPGRVGLVATVSTLDDRFKSFDRARPQFFYRDWNLENVPLRGREVVSDGEVSFARGESSSIRYSLGAIRRDDFDGLKHEGNLAIGTIADRGVRVRGFDTRADRTGEERTRRHLITEVSFGLWKVVPTVTYGNERYRQSVVADSDSGLAYERIRVRLANRKPRGLSMYVDVEQRDTDDVVGADEQWRRARRDRTVSTGVAMDRFRAVQGEMEVIHQEEDPANAGKATTDLARLKATIRASRVGIRSDVDYEISQAASRSLERSVIFLGEGKGDYNQQGDLVGKGKGSYTVVFSPTTSTTPTRSTGLSFRFVWKPRDVVRWRNARGWWGWIRRNVSFDQTVGVREETTFDPAWKVYLLVPSALQRDASTVFGVATIRQDWSLLDDIRNLNLTFRFKRDDTEDNRFEGIRENRLFQEEALRLSHSLSQRLTLTAETGRSVNRRNGDGISLQTGSRYDIHGGWLLGGAGVRFSAGSSVDVDVKGQTRNDRDSGAEQVILSVLPRLVWRVAEKVSVFASYEYNQAFDRGEQTSKPVLFGEPGGSHRWSIAPNIRLARVISIVATYSGRRETTFTGARITEHELRLETRALF